MNNIIERINLSDQVMDYLIDYIQNSRLKPGDLLPSEMEISEKLGVSRGIVREAFRSLKAKGLIEINNGKRATVQVIAGEAFIQLLKHGIVTEQLSVDQVLELRYVIEIGSVKLAAERASEEDIKLLGKLVLVMEEIEDDLDLFVKTDLKFHQTIAEATNNPLFSLLIVSIRTLIQKSIKEGLFSQKESLFNEIKESHRQIYESIKERNASQATEFMKEHLKSARIAVRHSQNSI
jgi:GntR family transcriptional regulator, transcriptional repressor for pyruvate dehydrogenase complex